MHSSVTCCYSVTNKRFFIKTKRKKKKKCGLKWMSALWRSFVVRKPLSSFLGQTFRTTSLWSVFLLLFLNSAVLSSSNSFGHLFYLTYLCSLGKFPSCCQLLLNHMFKCIIRGELPVSSTLLFTFILYLILYHIYQA